MTNKPIQSATARRLIREISALVKDDNPVLARKLQAVARKPKSIKAAMKARIAKGLRWGTNVSKITPEQARAAYAEHGSYIAAGLALGVTGPTVWKAAKRGLTPAR